MKPPEKIPSQRGHRRKKNPPGLKETPKLLVEATQRALEAPTALGQTVEDTLARLGIERAFQAPPAAPEPYTDETLGLLREKRLLELVINSELREQALENFWTFMTEVLYCTPDQRQHYIESFHRPICDMLQGLLKGENLMIVIPRESRKSYILRAFVCWLILRDFNIRIQIVAVTQDKAKKIATTVRQMFMEGTPGMEKLHEVFPECVIRGRRTMMTSQQFVHPMRTINSPDPTVFSTFLGSSGAGGRCMAPDGLVSTSQGLKSIGDIKVGEFVESHKGLFRRVVAKQVREVEEVLYSFDVVGNPTTPRITGDHKVLAWRCKEDGLGELSWIPAKELRVGDCMAVPKNGFNFTRKVFSNQESQEWFEEVYYKPEFWRLLGYWTAEGWRKKAQGKKKCYSVKMAFCAGEEWIEDCKKCAQEALGVKVQVHRRGPCDEIGFSHKHFYGLLEQIGGYAHTKKLPYWLLRTSFEHQIEFLRGYWRGDGCVIEGPIPRGSAVSVSLSLLYGIQKILTRAGWSSSLHKLRDPKTTVIRGRTVQQKKTWTLDCCDGRFLNLLGSFHVKTLQPPRTFFTPEYWLCPITEVMREDYKGEVVDIQVAEDHSYCSPGLTSHNCDLMVVDDGWDNRTLENPEVGVKVFKKFLSLVPLVEGSSLGKYKNIIILATPWKHYDPCSILLGNKIKEVDKEMGAELGRIPFKAYIRHSQEDPDRLCTACPPHVVRQFPHGHPAWDSGKPIMDPIFDKETLEAKKTLAMMDPAQGEEFFMLQYQCVYSFEEGQKFQPAWFVQLEQPTWSYVTQRIICLDDASKDFQTPGIGDFSVCLMGEFGEDGVLLIRYGLRSNRWTRDQFLSEIVSWCRLLDWWPHMVVKEKTSTDAFLVDFQKAFKPFYHRPIVLKPIPRGGGKSKNDLIAGSLQTPMERREILFGSQCPREVMDRARYELVNLGKTLNDDVADALSLFMHPDVRVIPRINRAIELAWTPPDLRSYLPQQDLPPITGLSMHPRTLELGLKVDQVSIGGQPALEAMWDMSKSGWGR